METNELKKQLRKISSESEVMNGKLVGEHDFYYYLQALEGKKIKWSLEVKE